MVSPAHVGVEGTILLRVSGTRRQPRVCGGGGEYADKTVYGLSSAPRTRG